jgi:hypothetical protein
MARLDSLMAAKVLSGFNILDAADNLCGYLNVKKWQNRRLNALPPTLGHVDSQLSIVMRKTLQQMIICHTLCLVIDIALFGILFS